VKSFELLYLLAEPFMHPLYRIVRKKLLSILESYEHKPDILDVGGRKSHYTTGIRANVTITDLPRETEVQRKKNLGINKQIIEQTYGRRSNVHRILFDDMTQSSFRDNSFDCIIAVEVLEHVEKDALFVSEVKRVLKPCGHFLFTTPNGEYFDIKQVNNPNNKRFYSRKQLSLLISPFLSSVNVECVIPYSTFRRIGKKPWSVKHPFQTGLSMIGNLISYFESTKLLRYNPQGTLHLIGTAKK